MLDTADLFFKIILNDSIHKRHPRKNRQQCEMYPKLRER